MEMIHEIMSLQHEELGDPRVLAGLHSPMGMTSGREYD
jgi:hypothetical protein